MAVQSSKSGRIHLRPHLQHPDESGKNGVPGHGQHGDLGEVVWNGDLRDGVVLGNSRDEGLKASTILPIALPLLPPVFLLLLAITPS